MDDPRRNERLRALPSIDELLARSSLAPLLSSHPRPLAVAALRRAVDAARARVLSGSEVGFEDADVQRALVELTTPNLGPVLNATGVVLHTNLGRAPLAARAVERIARVARGYCNLEIDLEEGERGSRYAPVVEHLRALTGAEDAIVVNNCASGLLLALGALAKGRAAVVSRGELVEIGGGFRVPEVMAESGARLVEVGTTNRTRLADYERALDPDTAVLVKVHRSNFALVGFTEEVPVRELADLAHRRGLPLIHDLGSGLLQPLHGEGLTAEWTVPQSVQAGADVVVFSGDKLLGGPQAGILVGTKAAVARLREHPLNRAVRVDKLTVAALEATLELYREGRADEVPVRRLLGAPDALLRRRAEALEKALAARGVQARVCPSEGRVGGGSMPLAAPRGWACALQGGDVAALHERLRQGSPAVLARLSDDQLLIDVRCIEDEALEVLAGAVARAVGAEPC